MSASYAIGIDVGGTGIKGAIIDTQNGTLASERIRVPTPEHSTPVSVTYRVNSIISELDPHNIISSVGICLPCVVHQGITRTAANISSEWIGCNAQELFTRTLKKHVLLLNDADAAGYAEARFGAAHNNPGLVIMTTLGTGIGSALIYNGTLIPNSELGHFKKKGHSVEKRASFAAKERENLSWKKWAHRLEKYYQSLEALFWPDLFIVGGGVSKKHERFLPLLDLQTPIVPAIHQNNSGMLGAAALAKEYAPDDHQIR